MSKRLFVFQCPFKSFSKQISCYDKNRGKNANPAYKLNINKQIISSTKSVVLLRVEIDNDLNFDSYISRICKKFQE